MRSNMTNPIEEQVKRLELANKSLENERKFKDEFIAMMAHEMKNTLASITSFSGILLNERFGPLNDSQKDRLGRIYDGAYRLNNLVRDVLDFQKIGLGQIKIEKEQYELEDLCKEAVLETTSLAELKNITIHANVDSVKIYCDYNRILQVLNNLLNNAIKFSKPNSNIILKAISDGKNILFDIIDHGTGIRKAEQPRVFNKFEQLKTGRNLEQEGSGLGLAICKGLVELHGGKIWLESTYGKGSKFTFTVPGRRIFSSRDQGHQ